MRFREVIGHDETKLKLLQAIKDDKVSHALFFSGKPGSGNLPMAIGFAQELMNHNQSGNNLFQESVNDDRVSRLVHPDLHFVFPVVQSKYQTTSEGLLTAFREMYAENPYMTFDDWQASIGEENKIPIISKFQSESIIEKLSLKSYEGGCKILVVWMPEYMNLPCANKLLKLIEEPPQKTLILMVGNDFYKLLTTIRSRVQLIRLDTLPDNLIAYELERNEQMNPKEASQIAHLVEGNYHAALKLAREDKSDNFYLDEFTTWMRHCFKADLANCTLWVNEFSGAGRDRLQLFLQYGLKIFRQCLIFNHVEDAQFALGKEETDFAVKFAPFINAINISPLSQAFEKGIYNISRNANAKILFLDLSFHIMKCLKLK